MARYAKSNAMVAPKAQLAAHQLLAVANDLNNRPRLILKGRSPAELFKALLASKNRPRCDVD